jgi:hypothetical protein
MTLKPFTKQTLFEEWNEKYNSLKIQIKSLKKRRELAETGEKLDEIEWELNILFERVNLIHNFLVDIGMLIEK